VEFNRPKARKTKVNKLHGRGKLKRWEVDEWMDWWTDGLRNGCGNISFTSLLSTLLGKWLHFVAGRWNAYIVSGVRSRVFTVENLASIFPWPIKSLGVVLPNSPSYHSPLTTCGTHKICTDRRQLSLESCAPLLVLDFLLVHCLFFRVPVWGLCEIFAAFSSHLHEQTGASNRKQKCDSISMETFLIPA